jgi:hypothetical protein
MMMWPPSGPRGPPRRLRTNANTPASTSAANTVAPPAIIDATSATCGIVDPWLATAGVGGGMTATDVAAVLTGGVRVVAGAVFLGGFFLGLVGGGTCWLVVGVLVDVGGGLLVVVGGGLLVGGGFEEVGGGGGGAAKATAAPAPATGATAQSATQIAILLVVIAPLARRLRRATRDGLPLSRAYQSLALRQVRFSEARAR